MNKYLPYIVIGILVLSWIVTSFLDQSKPSMKTIYKTDTITVYKTDTITIESPKYKYKKIIDTLYVYIKDSNKVSLPIEEKYYKEEGRYEAWIRGVNPSLEKINVFNKTIEKKVTNTEIRTIYKKSWNGYLNAQISNYDSKVIPSINLTINSPKSLSFGAGVGIYQNKPLYNFQVGYKLFGK